MTDLIPPTLPAGGAAQKNALIRQDIVARLARSGACTLADLAAAAGLLVLIAALTDGWVWLTRLALPILVLTGALGAVLGALIARHGSRLTIGGVFFLLLIVWLLALEALIDLYIAGTYRPGWSVIAAAAGLVAAVFLLIVRLRPRLREEFRRRFHT